VAKASATTALRLIDLKYLVCRIETFIIVIFLSRKLGAITNLEPKVLAPGTA
jgi:hypothetical protein